MVPGLLHIVCHHILKGQHPFNVEIPGACDQVLHVGVFCRELIADQVTAVIKIFSINAVIPDRVPAAGLDLSDTPPLLSRHGLW